MTDQPTYPVGADDPSPWDALHDGYITRWWRSGPSLCLAIECDYIRERFAEPGKEFVFELKDCNKAELTPYNGASTSDLAAIASKEWSIYGANWDGAKMSVVLLEDATLSLSYSELLITLDTGRAVPLNELKTHVGEYWSKFGSNP